MSIVSQSVIVFPGQGSQSIGMLDSFIDAFPDASFQVLKECSEAIEIDLHQLVTKGPLEELNQTEITQPLMLCADMVVWNVLQSVHSEKPRMLAGHSLGEYAALVASGVLNLGDATRIVRLRGQAMQQAVKPGVGAAAAVLGLSDNEVMDLCQQLSTTEDVVEAVNFNSPGQVVIAGHTAAV